MRGVERRWTITICTEDVEINTILFTSTYIS
jgi:hypothetical protein